MADPAVLKANVQAHLERLQRERAAAALTYASELDRMDAQILATQQVLAAWDVRVDGLIDRLTEAGIQILAG
jgi:hypothetical protein